MAGGLEAHAADDSRPRSSPPLRRWTYHHPVRAEVETPWLKRSINATYCTPASWLDQLFERVWFESFSLPMLASPGVLRYSPKKAESV